MNERCLRMDARSSSSLLDPVRSIVSLDMAIPGSLGLRRRSFLSMSGKSDRVGAELRLEERKVVVETSRAESGLRAFLSFLARV